MSYRAFLSTNGAEEGSDWSRLSQTLASNVRKISQNVNQIQRLINQLETSDDSENLRTQLHEMKETTVQLTRDSNICLKELAKLPQVVQSLVSGDQRNPLMNSLNDSNNRRTTFFSDNNSKQFSVEKFMTPSSLVSQKSNFYAGKTVFGGANTSRAARLAGATPYSLHQRHHLAPVLRVNVETSKRLVESSEPLSSSSQRILEKLEKASTPLQDARRIPSSSNLKNYLKTSEILYRSSKKPRLSAIPVFSQTHSETTFQPKRWELRETTNKDDQKVSANETTDHLINSCDNKYSKDSKIEMKSNENFSGKIMRRDYKREERRPKTQLSTSGDQSDNSLDLLTTAKPLTMPSNLPKFNFGSKAAPKVEKPLTTVITQSTESEDLEFKFSEPELKTRDQKGDTILPTGKNGRKPFIFSTPLSAITHKPIDSEKVEKESTPSQKSDKIADKISEESVLSNKTQPSLPVASVSAPSVSVPTVSSASVTVASVSAPAVSVTSVSVPSVSVPSPPVSVSVPSVSVPPLPVPSLSSPPVSSISTSVSVPSSSVPSVSVAAVTVAPVSVASVPIPSVTISPVLVASPSVPISSASFHSISIPSVSVASPPVPSVTVPSVSVPSLNFSTPPTFDFGVSTATTKSSANTDVTTTVTTITVTTTTTGDKTFGTNTLFGSNSIKGFTFDKTALNSSQTPTFGFAIPSSNSLPNTSKNSSFGLNTNSINTTGAESNTKPASNSLFTFGAQNSNQFSNALTQKTLNNTNNNSKTSSQFGFGLSSNPSTGQSNSSNLFANAINTKQNSPSFNQMAPTPVSTTNASPFTFGGFGSTPTTPAVTKMGTQPPQPSLTVPSLSFSTAPTFDFASSTATTKSNFSFGVSANTDATTTTTTPNKTFGANTLFGSNSNKGFTFGNTALNSSQTPAFSFAIPSSNSLPNTSSNLNFGLNTNPINATGVDSNTKPASNSLFTFGAQNSDQFSNALTQKTLNNTNTNSKTSSQFGFGLSSNPSTGQSNSSNLFANAINPTQNSLSFNQMAPTAVPAANASPFTFGGFGSTPSTPAMLQMETQQPQPSLPVPSFNFSTQPTFDFASLPNSASQSSGPVFQFSAEKPSQPVATNRNIKKAKRRLNPT